MQTVLNIHKVTLPGLPTLSGGNEFVYAISYDEFFRRARRCFTTNKFRKYRSAIEFMDSAKELPVVIIGAGPSLVDEIETLRDMSNKGAILVALNNAHDELIARGIVPQVAMMIEAKDRAVDYITPQPGVRYILGSQVCDAALEKFLPFADSTYLLHVIIDEEYREYIQDLARRYQRTICAIGGGSTVGMRAFDFATAVMKTRHVHFFGFDSSSADNGSMHARPKANAQDKIVYCKIKAHGRVYGKTYATTPTMRRQAAEMLEVIRLRAEAVKNSQMPAFGICFHGRGLLPDWMALYGCHRHSEAITDELKAIPNDDVVGADVVEPAQSINPYAPINVDWAEIENRMNSTKVTL